MPIMNAYTAFKLARSKGEKEIQPILKKIEKAAMAGDFELHLYEELTQQQKDELKKLGYEVVCTNYRNEPTTTITWKTVTPP